MNVHLYLQAHPPQPPLDEAAQARVLEPPPDCVMHRYPDGTWGWRRNPSLRKKIDEWKAAAAKAREAMP